jgi:hypothetical protein
MLERAGRRSRAHSARSRELRSALRAIVSVRARGCSSATVPAVQNNSATAMQLGAPPSAVRARKLKRGKRDVQFEINAHKRSSGVEMSTFITPAAQRLARPGVR